MKTGLVSISLNLIKLHLRVGMGWRNLLGNWDLDIGRFCISLCYHRPHKLGIGLRSREPWNYWYNDTGWSSYLKLGGEWGKSKQLIRILS